MPGKKLSKHYWHRRCWPWYDYDYDWYDYDYDPEDWDFYSAPRKARATPTVDDTAILAYQQGFKDGWMAAMDYAMYGGPAAEADPKPPMPPMPMPPAPPKPKDENPA